MGNICGPQDNPRHVDLGKKENLYMARLGYNERKVHFLFFDHFGAVAWTSDMFVCLAVSTSDWLPSFPATADQSQFREEVGDSQ